MRHWLGYRQRQEGKPSGPGAELGTEWHKMQQDWYQGRKDGRPRDELAVEIPGRHTNWLAGSERDVDLLGTLIWMWDGFLANGDPFLNCRVDTIEETRYVELPRIPGQPDWVTVMLKVKIDLLVVRPEARFERLIAVDHKSQAKHQSPEALSRDMEMDDQLGLYLFAVRQLSGVRASRLSACWSYAVTTDLKKTPRPPEDRFWLAWSARTDAELDRIGAEATESTLDAYRRPLEVEPPRHPDKEVCRWRCDFRDPCYYARQANRPVRLGPSFKPDQAPAGIARP